MKTKTNIISKKLFLVLFTILIMVGFVFLKSNPIQAKATASDSTKLGHCSTEGGSLFLPTFWSEDNVTKGQCKDDCAKLDAKYPDKKITCSFKLNSASRFSSAKIVYEEPSCHWLTSPFVCMLLLILRLMGMFLTLAVTIFAWIMKPANMSIVMGNNAVYQAWALVRDFLNIAFILVLLFSAFATIFQVDKYNYKKILLRLIIMALLVNFSYPIARFIIDFSNVLMYQILNNLGATSGAGIFSNIADKGDLFDIIHPAGSNPDKLYLLSAIIFVFILATTFLMIALMFVIRTVALAVLIIFSPVAFVGSIIPDIAGKAESWWNYLFKYALFGPIMVFMIELAVSMTVAISRFDQGKISMMRIAGSQSVDPGMIAAIATFSVPIVILWLGLGFAQSSSVAGAGVITQQGKKFMGGAGKWTGGKLGGNFVAGTYKHYKEERDKRKAILEEGRLRTRLGRSMGRKPGEWSDKVQGSKIWGEGEGKGKLGKLGKLARKATGVEEARNRMGVTRRENIQGQIKKWEKQGGAQEADLLANIHNKKKPIYQRQAATIELADKYGFKGKDAYKNYKEARTLVKGDSFLEKNLNDKVSKRRADLPLSYDIENPPEGKTGFSVAREKLFAMSSADLGKINFKELFGNSGDTAKDATEDYFKNIKTHRKNEILKNINPANEAFLETNLGVIFSPENPPKNPKNNANNTGNSGNKNNGYTLENGIWHRA